MIKYCPLRANNKYPTNPFSIEDTELRNLVIESTRGCLKEKCEWFEDYQGECSIKVLGGFIAAYGVPMFERRIAK
ncbi:MAG: hypothetical protein WC476_01495 [Phycisphaerae bacterium]|jgi:hypothetical protein